MKYVIKQQTTANMSGYNYVKINDYIWEKILQSFNNANSAYINLQEYQPVGKIGSGFWIDFFVEEIDE